MRLQRKAQEISSTKQMLVAKYTVHEFERELHYWAYEAMPDFDIKFATPLGCMKPRILVWSTDKVPYALHIIEALNKQNVCSLLYFQLLAYFLIIVSKLIHKCAIVILQNIKQHIISQFYSEPEMYHSCILGETQVYRSYF